MKKVLTFSYFHVVCSFCVVQSSTFEEFADNYGNVLSLPVDSIQQITARDTIGKSILNYYICESRVKS